MNRALRISLIISSLSLLVGCSSTKESTSTGNVQVLRSGSRSVQPEAQVEIYVLRQGDSIQVDVWGFSQFNTAGLVKPTGTLTIPLIGELQAAGLTKDQFTADLSSRLGEYIQGEIKLVITVTRKGEKKVTILGAVTRQESYPLPSDLTVAEALALAGGVTPEADLRHIRILRTGMEAQPIEVDLTWYVERGSIDTAPIVKAGDTIFVPKEENLIRDLSVYMGAAVLLFSFFVLFQ